MKKTLLAGFLTLGAMAFASGNTYKVNIYQDSVVEGKTLKAGEYRVSIENGNAVFKQGKASIEVPARVENESDKIANTMMTYKDSNELLDISVGGTHTKIVLEGSAPMQTGQ
jgi:hypothetical protein